MTKDKALEIYTQLKTMHPDARCELNFTTPFELLVAVILSAQCTDKRVNIATEKLFQVYNTPEQYAALTLEELSPYIRSCGFFNSKGKNIIAMSKELVQKYNGEVPKDLDKLTTLAGVGRKTASVVLAVAFDIPAMPVDTHVNRVSKHLALSDGNTVKKVEEDLKDLYPEELWNSLHHYLIFHGRYTCSARKPDCGKCLLKQNCAFYQNEVTK